MSVWPFSARQCIFISLKPMELCSLKWRKQLFQIMIWICRSFLHCRLLFFVNVFSFLDWHWSAPRCSYVWTSRLWKNYAGQSCGSSHHRLVMNITQNPIMYLDVLIYEIVCTFIFAFILLLNELLGCIFYNFLNIYIRVASCLPSGFHPSCGFWICSEIFGWRSSYGPWCLSVGEGKRTGNYIYWWDWCHRH